MSETVCEAKRETTVNGLLKENNEMILEIKRLSEFIKNNIYGNGDVKSAENPDVTCMMQALEIQNYNLRQAMEDLNIVLRTLQG